jgi:AcrR family transcriptional regulator
MGVEELGPLPAGRHRYSREQVAHHQRERLIAGLAAAVAEKGYAAVTLADVTRHARVSRRVFYENFEGKEQCLLAAFEAVVAHLRELVEEAVAGVEEWPLRVVAALRVVLSFLASEPDLARLVVVESRAAGPVAQARFNDAVMELKPLLEEGRVWAASRQPLPVMTEDSVLGSLVSLAYRRVAAGEATRLAQSLPACVELALTPYLGLDAAARLAT